MSRFYGSIAGTASTLATRCGSKSSGISGHIRGWAVGVSVDGSAYPDDKDVFHIYATGGSNGSSPRVFLGNVQLDESGIATFYPADPDGS